MFCKPHIGHSTTFQRFVAKTWSATCLSNWLALHRTFLPPCPSRSLSLTMVQRERSPTRPLPTPVPMAAAVTSGQLLSPSPSISSFSQATAPAGSSNNFLTISSPTVQPISTLATAPATKDSNSRLSMEEKTTTDETMALVIMLIIAPWLLLQR